MLSKICKDCGEDKPLEEFAKDKTCSDGHTGNCKDCRRTKKLALERTKKGLVRKIYNAQIHRSKHRGHTPPSYTLHGLRQWFKASASANHLYKAWKASGYSKGLIPSVDRIDDYKPYSLDNIQLTTWDENRQRYDKDKVNGVNNKQNMAVIQLTLEGEFVAEFHSVAEANRQTGMHNNCIAQCCNGEYRHSGGFRWEYK